MNRNLSDQCFRATLPPLALSTLGLLGVLPVEAALTLAAGLLALAFTASWLAAQAWAALALRRSTPKPQREGPFRTGRRTIPG